MTQTLKIGLPKKGRLKDDANTILQNAGLEVAPAEKRKSTTSLVGLAADVKLRRDSDILRDLQAGILNAGIVGFDKFEEFRLGLKDNDVDSNLSLRKTFNGFSDCRLVVAIPDQGETVDILPSWLNGKTIYTSYPAIARDWLQKQNVQARVEFRDGDIEDYTLDGEADAIFDITETGSTIKAYGLVECFGPIRESSAVLVVSEETAPGLRDDLEAFAQAVCQERSPVFA